LNLARQEAERELGQDEIREFNTRIGILKQELECKNLEISQVAEAHKEMEDFANKIMYNNTEVDIKESSEEIKILNNKYRKALADKIKVYD